MAQWSIPFDEIAKRQNQRIATVVRAFTLELFTRVVIRSPVDTGRFRANWQIGYGAPNVTVTSTEDPAAKAKLGELKRSLLSMQVGGVVYLTNSLPYAMALEYGLYPDPPKYGSKKRGETEMTIHVVGGYSTQAPDGMVRVTAREMAQAVKVALEQR